MKNLEPEYGKLTVLESFRRGGRRWATCICQCGTKKDVLVQSLNRGATRSCGCGMYPPKHGLTNVAGYKAWESARRRCHNPSDKSYPRYGGRGIVVAEEWREDPRGFIEELGPRPSTDHSVDRIDNSRGYEPGNIRWATREDQCANKRSTKMLVLDGEEIPLTVAARKYGIKASNIWNRIRRGWSHEQAVYLPVKLGTPLKLR